MILTLLRGLFLVLVSAVAALYLLSSQAGQQLSLFYFVLMLGGALGLALLIILADLTTPHKKLSALSGVILGLIAGLVVAFAISFVVDLVGVLTAPEITQSPPLNHGAESGASPAATALVPGATAEGPPPAPAAEPAPSTGPAAGPPLLGPSLHRLAFQRLSYWDQVNRRQAYLNLLQGVKVVIGLITCYLSISLVLQTRGDFRFVIPYVEFAKETRGARPTILDTSVVIDGRVLDIAQTRLIQAGMIVPRFVLQELHTLSDSADKLKRARGRRGLDVLQKLQANPVLDVDLDDTEVEGASVDQKLIVLAQQLSARIMTNDFNLNKLASLRGVTVINLNDLAAALRPVVLPGEAMRVKIVKAGEGPHQGVGYLDDGTMVVVENARAQIGQEVELVVTSSLQTSAGRMFFGRCQGPTEGSSPGPAEPDRGGPHGLPPVDPEPTAPGVPAPPAAAPPTLPAAGDAAARDDANARRGRPNPNPRNPRRQ